MGFSEAEAQAPFHSGKPPWLSSRRSTETTKTMGTPRLDTMAASVPLRVPPVPIHARIKEADAQLENARASLGVSWKGILVTIVLVLAILVLFYLIR
jgi:ABC-type spermidine/putrescine transport system permease subunit II